MTTTAPILMYHQVSPHVYPSFRKYTVTPRAFDRQITWLARAGFTSVTLDALLDARHGVGALPRRPVVITFDDGMRDCAEFAGPVLRDHGFTATFFLVSGLMGGSSRWLLAERGVEVPLMDWRGARELEEAGFHCGAHSVTHPRLAELPTYACREEIVRSRFTLEDELGHEVRHFAYPFGSYDDRVRGVVEDAGFRSACSVRIGISAATDDPLALHRVPVNGEEGFIDFVCRVRSGRPGRELVRGVATAVLRGLTGRAG